MKPYISILFAISLLQISAEPVKIRTLYELQSLSGGESYTYVGRALVYQITANEMTVDDGSTFMTISFLGSQPVIDVNEGDIVRYFEGYARLGEMTSPSANGMSLQTISEYETGERCPLVANNGDTFEDYPNRMVIFQNVSIVEDASNPDALVVTTAGGSRGLIDRQSCPDIKVGEGVCIECTPKVKDNQTVWLNAARVIKPVQVITSLDEFTDLPWNSVFIYKGDATVYYSQYDKLTIDDGESFRSFNVEYIPSDLLPRKGDVVKGFSGRVQYYREDGSMGGGISFRNKINGKSLEMSHETRELVPIMANEDETFDDYLFRLSTFKNVTIESATDYAPNSGIKYIVKLGGQELGATYEGCLIGDKDPEDGEYETLTCIPVYTDDIPWTLLTKVVLGNKAGVETIASDSDDSVVRYIDVYGRSYDTRPCAHGIYIGITASGKTIKMAL